MDDFTAKHLGEYAESACFDDEREAFVAWVTAMEPDDLEYYTNSAGWPPALNHFRNQQTNTNTGETK